MFTRAALSFAPQCGQVRNMATLKEISIRLKSVKSIQKITKSMKMVSAAKYARAEKELKPARPYGAGAKAFFDKAELQAEEPKPATLLIAVTSDRGLCGAVHSTVVKQVRAKLAEAKNPENIKVVVIGDKARLMLRRNCPENFLFCVSDVGRQAPQFGDAATIAVALLESGYEFDVGALLYNQFKSVISYISKELPVFSMDAVSTAGKISLYDSLDDEVLRSYNEFALASLTYFAMKEGAASEQSSRMTAMDGASKNAGEMIDKLTMTYNRTRQAVITRELIEIISGAAALK